MHIIFPLCILNCFSFTDDPVSSFVSTSHDETALLWHWNQVTNAVDCINVCKGHSRSVDCVAVSPETNRVYFFSCCSSK